MNLLKIYSFSSLLNEFFFTNLATRTSKPDLFGIWSKIWKSSSFGGRFKNYSSRVSRRFRNQGITSFEPHESDAVYDVKRAENDNEIAAPYLIMLAKK